MSYDGNNMNWEDACMNQSRRQILKLIAAAPLAIPLGFASDALMRFAKPTMSPLGFFDPADLPTSAIRVAFHVSDFPEPWTCIPFLFQMKIAEFNPEQQEIRNVPAFAIRLQEHEIVAYSRKCPRGNGCILQYRANPHNCGCHPELKRCCSCAIDAANPVLVCPRDLSVFDLAHHAKVIQGPAPRPPRSFQLDRQGDTILVVGLEFGGIA